MKYQFVIEIITQDGDRYTDDSCDPVYDYEIKGSINDACDRALTEVMGSDFILVNTPMGRGAINMRFVKTIEVWAKKLEET